MPKRILVVPLNWGLGHATRCIPVVRELQRQGAEVMLASDGRALELLKREFPELTVSALPGYHIRYHGDGMIWDMARQLPRILWGV
ncbi:MAG: glycosyltransferase, partial [Saprospiraceae bacterium]